MRDLFNNTKLHGGDIWGFLLGSDVSLILPLMFGLTLCMGLSMHVQLRQIIYYYNVSIMYPTHT